MKKALYINLPGRGKLSPDECKGTMTVGELVTILRKYDESTPVYVRSYNRNLQDYDYYRTASEHLFTSSQIEFLEALEEDEAAGGERF